MFIDIDKIVFLRIKNMIKLEKDSWYKLYGSTGRLYYFKFEKLYDGYYVYSYGFYILDNMYYIDDHFSTKNYLRNKDLTKLIDISSIIEYLPNGNIDKIIYIRKNRIKNLLNES